MGAGDTWTNALVGAAVSVVLSLTGIGGLVAPLVGGGVAGYLNREEGFTVGALSGILSVFPVVLLFVLFGSVILSFVPVGGAAVGAGAAFVLLVVIAAFAFFSVLGAVGGYVGEYLYREDVV
jgi:hypothetical protein